MMQVAEKTEAYLQGHDIFACDGLDALRNRAKARFREVGPPHTRQEAWRFTNPKRISALKTTPVESHTMTAETVAELRDGAEIVLVFENGRLNLELSSVDNLPEGLTISRVAQLDDLAPLGDIDQAEGFDLLNLAMLADGIVLDVAPGATIEQPIQIMSHGVGGDQAAAIHLRHLIRLGEGASLTVLESATGDAGYWQNNVVVVDLARNATLKHYLKQRDAEEACHTSLMRVHQKGDSRLETHNLLIGANLSRRDLNITLAEEGADAQVYGLFVTHYQQLADIHIHMDHAAPKCTSNQYIKGILEHKSRGVFSGHVTVRQDAQLTDSKQTNRNLLLSDDARVDSMPRLEIYADDVKCAHGATTGQLDTDALFYLATRGVDPVRARELLLHAFTQELVDKLPLEAWRTRIGSYLDQRFQRRGATEA